MMKPLSFHRLLQYETFSTKKKYAFELYSDFSVSISSVHQYAPKKLRSI